MRHSPAPTRRIGLLPCALALCITLASCGGGGGGSSNPPPVVTPPFTTVCAAAPGSGVTAPFPTLTNISLEWAYASVADQTSDVSVRYRTVGSTAWTAGMPLRRVLAGTTHEGYSWPGRHSGSVFDVAPGNTYEIELTRKRADDTSTTQCVLVTTRSEPRPADNAITKLATPSNLTLVLSSAQAGDVIELSTGIYQGFTVASSGEAGRPLVLRPRAGATVTINGRVDIEGHHVMLTRLTINGMVKFNGANHFTITHSTVNAVGSLPTATSAAVGGDGIVTKTRAESAYIADNTVTGITPWRENAMGSSGYNAGEGIEVNGPGHVIMNNRVSGFRDNISLLEGGEAKDQYSIDILNNDLSEAADDAIEADFCKHNCRIMGNRITNAFIGLSSQPGLGGPTYFVRNVLYNVAFQAFKLQRGSTGDVLLHNTVVRGGDAFGMASGVGVYSLYSRNNLMLGGGSEFRYNGWRRGPGLIMAMSELDTASADMDYDAFGSSSGFSGSFGSANFANLTELQTRTTEKHAQRVDLTVFSDAIALPLNALTQFAPPTLTLKAPVVGVSIPGINTGATPSVGAYEYNTAPPHYGPRL